MRDFFYVLALSMTMMSCSGKDKNDKTPVVQSVIEDPVSETKVSEQDLEPKAKEVDLVAADTIKNKLTGVWYGLNNGINDLNDIDMNHIYKFDSKILFVGERDSEDAFIYGSYDISENNCENAKNKDGMFLKIIDGGKCSGSSIVEFKALKGKTYLILKENITDVPKKVFVKLTDDPNFVPDGF